MLLAAAITYDIAKECRERHIPNCPCDFSVPFITQTENGTIVGGCGAQFDHASGVTRKIMAVSPTGTSADLVVQHNTNAGAAVSTTPTHCPRSTQLLLSLTSYEGSTDPLHPTQKVTLLASTLSPAACQ